MPTSTQSNAYNGAQVTGRGVLYDASGNAVVIGANMPFGASAGLVLTSDAAGDLSWQPVTSAPLPGDAGLVGVGL